MVVIGANRRSAQRGRRGEGDNSACCSRILKTSIAVAAYFFGGIVVTTYNKWLLHYHNFHYPIFLIMCTSLLNSIMIAVTILLFFRDIVEKSPNWITRISFQKFVFTIIPIGVFFR